METNLQDIKLFMDQLSEAIDKIVDKRMTMRPVDRYQSDQLNELVAALAKAQTEYPSIGKNRTNPFFKSEYADFDSIMNAIRPVLSKNGLVLSQFTVIDIDSQSRTLHTRLFHASGQWMESRQRIVPEKNDDQKFASSVTFNKRHQAMAILNITISDDMYDDDAERNVQDSRMADIKGTATNHNYQPNEQRYETVNAHEHAQLQEALKGWPDLAKAIMNTYKISSLADLPREKYAHVIKQIRTNIEQRTKGTAS